MKSKIIQVFRNFYKLLTDETLTIQHRLSNLIILASLIGSIICLAVSQVINESLITSVSISMAIVVIGYSLYLSVVKRKDKIAAMIIIIFIDEFIFPMMLIGSGGIRCGMSCWLIVGLIFPFLVLSGIESVLLFLMAFFTYTVYFILEYMGVIQPNELSELGWYVDVIQSVGIVAIILGIIFKFQTSLYSKQNAILVAKEKELSAAIEDVKAADKAKTSFLANMSHEIRTPINAIMGLNEIILRDCTDEMVIQNSEKIQTASNALLSLINNILDFSKIESGNTEIIEAEYSLTDTIMDIYNMTYMRAFNKGLQFRVMVDKDVPKNLKGDEFHIRQIALNLLTNAVKYTNEGHVDFIISKESMEEGKIMLSLKVKDTGAGISEEDKDKLFKSFQRIDERKNRTIEGTGLGLIISKKLAQEMGGDITVDTELNVGSTFNATIPQTVVDDTVIGEFSCEKNEKIVRKKEEKRRKFVASNVRILVVDDTVVNLTVVKGLLKSIKSQIDTATGGKEALKLTATNKYDIIFLDHMMPEMDGVDTFRELKKQEGENKDTPVIMLTANAIKGAEEEYLKEGFNGYLSKPIKGADLEETVYNFVSKDKIKIVDE